MDGLFHGKPYEQMDDLGGPPLFSETSKLMDSMTNLLKHPRFQTWQVYAKMHPEKMH